VPLSSKPSGVQQPISTALFAATEEREGVAFDIKIRLIANSAYLIYGQADIDLHDAVALCAGQMVMMARTTADAIVMRAVRELDAVQELHIRQHLDRAIDRCASQAWLGLPQLLPQIINGEIGTAGRQLYQPLGDELARARMTLARFVERRPDLIRDHICLSFSASLLVRYPYWYIVPYREEGRQEPLSSSATCLIPL
jgi:hypothetical protein